MDQRDRGVTLAIEAAGSTRKLAESIGLTRQAVYQWKRIPAEQLQAVARATRIPARLLRPDLYQGAAE